MKITREGLCCGSRCSTQPIREILLLLILLMGPTICARAETEIDSGGSLLNACKVASAALDGILKSRSDFDDLAKTIACVAYARGFADSYENTSSVIRFAVRSALNVGTEPSQKHAKRKYGVQRSSGPEEVTDPVVIATLSALEGVERGLRYCVPDDADNRALVRAIVRQGDVVSKDILKMPPVFLADLAFLSSFPCTKQRK